MPDDVFLPRTGGDPQAVSRAGAADRRPMLWVALGRQRVGKTVVLSAVAQFFRARGVALEVWNADQQNRSHSLSRFFPDALSPGDGGGLADGRDWIMERVDALAAASAEGGGDGAGRARMAVLDVGGGFTGFSTLAERVPLDEVLASAGVRAVGLFVVGPERADLDYLEHFAADGRFLPAATAIVLNEGLVEEGRSATRTFAAAVAHGAVQDALARKAVVVRFPVLGCVSQVADGGLTYEAVLRGEYGPGQRRLGLFPTAEVRRFWSRDLPRFLAQFPPAWLPCPVEAPAPSLGAEGGSAGTAPTEGMA